MRQAGSAIRAGALPRGREDDAIRGLGHAILLAVPLWAALAALVWVLA